MGIITNSRLAALAAATVIGTAAMQAAGPSKPTYSYGGKGIIISKVMTNISKTDNGVQWQDQYVELFNNTHNVLDLSGLYLGLTDTESKCPPGFSTTAVAALTDRASLADSVVLKQVFRIPESANALLAPGKSLIICNCAVKNEETGIDLSDADFEIKSTNKNYSQHNDNVPAMETTYTFNSNTDFMNLTVGGPQGVVLLAYNTEFSSDYIYGLGKEKGTQYIKAPASKVLDGMEILKYKDGVDATTKRLINSIDSGYVYTDQGNYSGEVYYRKTALAGSRYFLFDTNNSTADWGKSTSLLPRQYDDEVYGVTDTVVTVPASGLLPICPSKPFYGSSDVTLITISSSSKSDILDLNYTGYQADTCIAMASAYILMAKPGDHTLKLTDWGATLSGSSSSGYTKGEGDQEVSVNKNRILYKFVDNGEEAEFDSVYATTTAKGTFALPANTYYITLTKTGKENMEKNHGVSSVASISWRGGTPGLIDIDEYFCKYFDGFLHHCDKYHTLDFTNVEGITAYYLKAVTDEVATLQEVSGPVAPGTGIIVKADAAGTFDIPYATEVQ